MEAVFVGPAMFVGDGDPDGASTFGVGVGGEGAGPGDVAVTGRVERVGAFAEGPASPGVGFAQRKVVGRDVGLAFREALARLRISVAEVTNCRKRLDRKLEALAETEAGIPRWVIEEWKRK